MSIWILFVIAIVAMVLGSLFRQPRKDARLPWERSEWRREERPVPERRRVQPPPLPRPPVPQWEQVIPVAVAAPVAEAPVPKAAIVERKAKSQAAAQVAAFLQEPKTMRAAMLLHTVLAPPLCKRRWAVSYGPGGPLR
jgi:hypothetical protein